MAPEQSPQPHVVSSHVVELSNEYSHRPNPAHLHAQQLDNGEVKLFITGIDLGCYEDVVGPERAAAHRRLLERGDYSSQRRTNGFMGLVRAAVDKLFY
jgi:hypothetical protein